LCLIHSGSQQFTGDRSRLLTLVRNTGGRW
jgi:hypothetical protein